LGAVTLRIVFHFVNTEDGPAATLDSPDQGANGLPVTSVTRNGSALRVEMKALGAMFEGKISEDRTKIEGQFSQAGNDFPLVLTRVPDGK